MRQRNWILALILIGTLAPVVACNDDPTSPPFSIEEEINLNGPYDRITIYVNGTVRAYTSDGDGRHFWALRADDGLLVLEMSDGDTLVFNLTTADAVEISDATLVLRY